MRRRKPVAADASMSTRVEITLSDPWDLVTACGAGPLAGTVRDRGPRGVLVELDAPIHYDGRAHLFAMCQPRHEGTAVSELLSGSNTPVSIGLIAASSVPSIEDGALRRLKGTGAIGSVKASTLLLG